MVLSQVRATLSTFYWLRIITLVCFLPLAPLESLSG